MKQLTLLLIVLTSLSGAELSSKIQAYPWSAQLASFRTLQEAPSLPTRNPPPTVASTRITGNQLERMLVAVHGKPDGEVAEQLSRLELTDRLSASRLARCTASLPGPMARQAFTGLVDQSAFLDLPAGKFHLSRNRTPRPSNGSSRRQWTT